MEHIVLKPGQPLYEADGPPSMFFCGFWDGHAHLLRFGPEDGVDDAIRECRRFRTLRRPGKRLDFPPGIAQE